MQAAISKMCRHADKNKMKIALSMKAKYDKYWDNWDNMNVLLYGAEDDSIMKIYLDDGFSKYLETQYGIGWWNQNMMKFPILSQVAKHVLAMSISTVASESAFSTGGRVIDKYRSSLTPKTAEALIFERMVGNLEKLDLDGYYANSMDDVDCISRAGTSSLSSYL
ncbi:zinc finger BED domain-containing protein RICESLEEPER 2-like protein [Tanacetum coccineum]